MSRPPHSRSSFSLILIIIAFALTATFVSIGHSSGRSPQDNRQLQRDSSRASASERRTALVIGNGAYTNAPVLKNPPNDATLVAATLKKLGFEVSIGTNKSQREMKQLIREFGQRLRAGGGVGLFYFAGHGVQSKGHNYLVPIDADIQNEADLEDIGVDVNYVLNMMDDAQSALNIVILDACRNNPFARSLRSAQGGLAQVKAPTGTLIAYATAPDSTAADGDRANSPYTEELTRQMETSGVVLETMFRRVTEQVSARSGGKQEPWVSDNHKGEFYFSSSSSNSNASNATNAIGPASISDASKEQALWEAVKDSNDAQDFKDYLAKYPNGAYAQAATVMLRRIEARTSSSTNSPMANSSMVKACNFVLGPEIYKKWMEYGGEKGFLGCPTMDESEAVRSPQGTTGRFSRFENGNAGIHCHSSGQYVGKCFAMDGAIYAEYGRLGGSQSWLGFQVSQQHDVVLDDCPIGCLAVDYEGGSIVLNAKSGKVQPIRSRQAENNSKETPEVNKDLSNATTGTPTRKIVGETWIFYWDYSSTGEKNSTVLLNRLRGHDVNNGEELPGMLTPDWIKFLSDGRIERELQKEYQNYKGKIKNEIPRGSSWQQNGARLTFRWEQSYQGSKADLIFNGELQGDRFIGTLSSGGTFSVAVIGFKAAR